jgi:hypothetical protein
VVPNVVVTDCAPAKGVKPEQCIDTLAVMRASWERRDERNADRRDAAPTVAVASWQSAADFYDPDLVWR